MELELTSDQELFVDTARRFLTDTCPPTELRNLRHSPEGFDRAYWRQGAELGWTSLLVADDDGGGSVSGAGVRDLALVANELGRHAAPGPLLPTNVVAAALSRFGTGKQKAQELRGLLTGDLVATWCLTGPRPLDDVGDVRLAATETGARFRLTGRKSLVEAGAQADLLLVAARHDDRLTQVLVPADAPGVTIAPLHSLDLTRRFAEITFSEVEVPATAVVGEPGEGQGDVDTLLRLAIVIQLAEMVGAMGRALDITIEWAFDRYTFGRPLASYQELKHRFADMKMWLEASHAIADAAAAAVQENAPDAAELVSAGKAYVGRYGPELVQDCVQMHGGIGLTFDHDLHLYLRRVVIGSMLYGTVAEHHDRLTVILEEREDAA